MGIAVSAARVRKRARAGVSGCSAMGDLSLYECRMQNAEWKPKKVGARVLFFALAALLCALPAFAQFHPALPGYEFEFPRDHGSHDEYKTEWWYYTGHLRTDDGRRYGFELTFFRVGVIPPAVPLESRWDLRNLALAHFAVSDIDGKVFRFYERLNRSSPFTAGAAAGRLDVFNESWRAGTLPDGSWRIAAIAGDGVLDIVLRTRKPPAGHGENGISGKAGGGGDATASYWLTRARPGAFDAWLDRGHVLGRRGRRQRTLRRRHGRRRGLCRNDRLRPRLSGAVTYCGVTSVSC